MKIQIKLTDGPICEPKDPLSEGAGAMVEFRGVVRGLENGEVIAGLRYEVYQPMAQNVIRQLLGEIASPAPCLAVWVIHRYGTIPVGEAAIYMRIDGRHRGEAFVLLEEFMNRLKKDVPIWKVGSC